MKQVITQYLKGTLPDGRVITQYVSDPRGILPCATLKRYSAMNRAFHAVQEKITFS